MPCAPRSARRARALVGLALGVWELGALGEDGDVVVSELVGNAVKHTESRAITVTVARLAAGRVRITVSDTSPKVPVLRTAGTCDEDGRGMAVIAALCGATGSEVTSAGKETWAELSASAGP